jgi:8-oxo-dGTP pyrophosphatase MutT (NUDIX family)
MQFHSFLEFVPKIQELRLPGLSEQLTMAPAIRKQLINKPIINPKKAAVICLFFEGMHGETCFYLIRRSSYPGVHSNQVGFPGGQIDSVDQTPWEAAKRELWEELGISPQKVTQIREITPLYIPPSHFWVDCFLAYSKSQTELNLDPNEVKEVISVSLAEFINLKKSFTDQLDSNGNKTPIYNLSDNTVWGATAMILAEIKSIIFKVLN